MLFVALIVLVAVVGTLATNSYDRSQYEKLFYDHITKYNLKFQDGKEFIKRLQVFADNFDAIEAHNAQKLSYTMGLNQFSHLTHDEFLDAVRLGGTRPPNFRKNGLKDTPKDITSLASSIDWVSKGAVTGVKNQGSCGSCWSFSTTGALEGAYYLKYGSLISFSEQQLVSCDTTDSGCNGGWMDTAFDWVKANGGITTEDAYPYTSSGGSTGTCTTTGYTNNANVAPKSYTDVTENSVSALMTAVSSQPVSIAIQANQIAFQSYSSGVLTGRCGTNLDHGVLLVGYGTYTDGTDYWKVKNSWGDSWGMDGYILIERSDDNLCGVLSAASYPTL